MTEEIVPRQTDEEIRRWHGVLDVDDDARQAMEDLAREEGMPYDEAVLETLRRRYRHSQVDWPRMIGEEPREKLQDHSPGISITTFVALPSGKTLSLTTHTGLATEIKLGLAEEPKIDLSWTTKCYTWIADPFPKTSSVEGGVIIGTHMVDEMLGGKHSVGKVALAEELMGEAGLSFKSVQKRLDELVREGTVKVEDFKCPPDACGPHILREEFTRAIHHLALAEFHARAMYEAHLAQQHGGDIGDAYGDAGWTCAVCRERHAYSDEITSLESILWEGEKEAASHFVTETYKPY